MLAQPAFQVIARLAAHHVGEFIPERCERRGTHILGTRERRCALREGSALGFIGSRERIELSCLAHARKEGSAPLPQPVERGIDFARVCGEHDQAVRCALLPGG